MAKFRERFLKGEIPFDDIFDLTDEWNMSDDPIPLREYLGLTAHEEDIWVEESDEALEDYMNREKNRRIFFTDLDGTLLRDDKSLSPAMRDLLRQISAAGNPIVISTGRFTKSAIIQFNNLGIDPEGCYLITCNGAQVFDIERRKFIHETSVGRDMVRSLFDEAANYGIHIQTYNMTHVLTEHDTPELQLYCEIQKLPYIVTDDVTSLLEKDPPKLLAIKNDDHECVLGFYEKVRPMFEDKLDFFFSNPYYLEIVAKGTCKGEAIRHLCEHLLIPIERSVAAGDAENDISMIKAAGTGIAMANGEEAVKAAADRITKTDNNHDGLLPILKEIFLDS